MLLTSIASRLLASKQTNCKCCPRVDKDEFVSMRFSIGSASLIVRLIHVKKGNGPRVVTSPTRSWRGSSGKRDEKLCDELRHFELKKFDRVLEKVLRSKKSSLTSGKVDRVALASLRR